MNNPEKSGSRLFPGDKGRIAVNMSSIDVSVELFLKAGLFAKLRDDGVYVKKIHAEMAEPLENMKSLPEDTPKTNGNLAAQYLADAYAKARRFVLSSESKEHLSIFSTDDFEKLTEGILDEVRNCLSIVAKLLEVEEDFGLYLNRLENSSAPQPKKDTIPYGVKDHGISDDPVDKSPFLPYEAGSDARRHFFRSTTQNFPAINLAEEARKASLEEDTLTAKTSRESVPVSTPPASRNTLPPPPMAGAVPDAKLETLNAGTEAKKYFKKRFLDVYKSEFLKKLRDTASAKSDSKTPSKDGKIFEEAFDYIGRKAYLQITSDTTGNPAVLALHDLVEKKVAGGAEWKSIIRKLGEDAVANEAQEAMRIYVPIITAAYLSHDKYREKILNIEDGNDDLNMKQEDAANCVLHYIRENMFKTATSSKLDAVVYLGYFFRETRSDLGLIIYEEVYAAAGDIFAKIRHKDIADKDPEISLTEEQNSIQEEEEPMPATLRGTGIEPTAYTVKLTDELREELPEDDEEDTIVEGSVVNPIVPKTSTIEPLISYRAEAPTIPTAIKVEETPSLESVVKKDETSKQNKGGLWNRFKNSKAGKVATGLAFAAATVMAGYAGGVFSNSEKQSSTDTTQAAATVTASSNVGPAAFSQPAGVSSGEAVDVTNTSPGQNVAEPVQNAEPYKVYTIHLEKIAGDNTRLKNLVEKESFEREPGNRGDFEQLHSIVGQGALTANQQNKLHEELNGKYNRGEYGSATKRFRPLLENGELFKVLGNANHPQHSELKAAVAKFGNPSYWSWSRKKPVMENGKMLVKSMPYEEMHSEDVEFFEQCQKDFEALGLGKDGNVHYRGGETGERIPLKINGKWITFVETALQIRGVIEARGVQDIPAPPASIMNDTVAPAETVPTNVAPVDMEIDLQPDGHGKEGYLHFDTPEIEMGETVEMAMSDLEDDPSVEVCETEMDDDTLMAVIDDGWDIPEVDSPTIEVRETEMDDDTLLAVIDDDWDTPEVDSPTVEVRETEMDDDTLLAVIDDGWDTPEVEISIEKTLQKVKLSV